MKPGPADVRIFPPYPDEVPWDLLADADGRPAEFGAAAQLRVAKFDGEVVGVYVVEPDEPLVYCLRALVVATPYRRRGLGRWLLGHAIGLAESKGGRELRVSARCAAGFFRAQHFESVGAQLRLPFTPE